MSPPRWEDLSDAPPAAPGTPRWEDLSDAPRGVSGGPARLPRTAAMLEGGSPLERTYAGIKQGGQNLAAGLGALPFVLAKTPGRLMEDVGKLWREPGPTVREFGQRFVAGLPMQETGGALLRGKLPPVESVAREVMEAGAPFLLGGKIPRAAEMTGKGIVRGSASSASRMEAGAQMMERMPGRFGVNRDLVNRLYDTAERLSTQSMTQAPLMAFRKRLADAIAEQKMNPLDAMRNKTLIGQLQGTLDQLGQRGNSMTARQVNAVIKSVNDHIGSTEGATRGMWKQALGGLHEDMRTAWQATRDPAFGAYERAIHAAWKNFLLEDFDKVLKHSGMPMNRAGTSPIVAPGKIQQWITDNPQWVQAVEKAEPGLLNALQADLERITPVTNITAPSIPGGHFGSGRLVAGGALGHIFRRVLGLGPGMAEAIGVLMGDLTKRGIHWNPVRVERAFQPPRSVPFSPSAGARVGLPTMAGEREASRPADR